MASLSAMLQCSKNRLFSFWICCCNHSEAIILLHNVLSPLSYVNFIAVCYTFHCILNTVTLLFNLSILSFFVEYIDYMLFDDLMTIPRLDWNDGTVFNGFLNILYCKVIRQILFCLYQLLKNQTARKHPNYVSYNLLQNNIFS